MIRLLVSLLLLVSTAALGDEGILRKAQSLTWDKEPPSVREALKYLAAVDTVVGYETLGRDKMLNRSMGCGGLLSCPGDGAILYVAGRARAITQKQISHPPMLWPVYLTGKLRTVGQDATDGHGLFMSILAADDGRLYVTYGRAPVDFVVGDRVEIVGALGAQQSIGEHSLPALAVLAMMRPGSLTRLRAAYGRQ